MSVEQIGANQVGRIVEVCGPLSICSITTQDKRIRTCHYAADMVDYVSRPDGPCNKRYMPIYRNQEQGVKLVMMSLIRSSVRFVLFGPLLPSWTVGLLPTASRDAAQNFLVVSNPNIRQGRTLTTRPLNRRRFSNEPKYNPSLGVSCEASVNPKARPSPAELHGEPAELASEISSVKSKFRVTSIGTISSALVLLL